MKRPGFDKVVGVNMVNIGVSLSVSTSVITVPIFCSDAARINKYFFPKGTGIAVRVYYMILRGSLTRYELLII